MTGTDASTAPGLNTSQQEAVAYTGGPLIVLAGPGTGKTRVIIHRIARLIDDGAPPESIVAVTYTVKAARQLRERLADLVGGPAADRVNAHTFHGFGYRLIRRFSDYLGLPATVRIIDSAQTRRLLRSLIREHDLFPELIPLGRDSILDSAIAAIGVLANHAISPDRAADFCRQWAGRLATNADGLDAEKLAADRIAHARFEQMARLCRLFRSACASRGWLTFDDLILLPIRVLREREAAAVICRDEYRHWVVDEFQDVNQAQIELLALLCPPGRRAGSDLCIVGDDDQSIYEFRGADDQAFSRFARTWPGSTTITLTQNYRSQQPIIDTANAIMAAADRRFAPDKIVERPAAFADEAALPGAGVECITLEGDFQAGEVVAASILADRAGAEATTRAPRPWRDFAVIARSHNDLERIAAALSLEAIPVRLARGPSALDDRGIKDLLRWVELLASPPGSATAAYASQWILTRPPFQAGPAAVNEWAQAHRALCSRRRVESGDEPPFLGWLLAQHGDDPLHGSAVCRLHALEADLRAAAAQSTAAEAIFHIIRRADIAHAELLPGRERARRVGHLAQVMRFVHDRLDALDPPADLRAFWSYYQDLSEEEQAFRAAGEDRIDGESDDSDEERADAVTLLTAHSAKGLEFDTVFVPRCRPGGYPGTRSDSASEVPEGLIDRGDDRRSVTERRAAEERRLFYVAATRAQRRLIVLAASRKSRTKNTDFFNELTLDEPCCSIVTSQSACEVLQRAAAVGVRLSTHSPLTDAAPAGPGAPYEARARLLDQARQEARLSAAGALDQIDTAAVTPERLEEVHQQLKDAAEHLAVAAFIAEFGDPPAWAQSEGALGAYAQRLAALARVPGDHTDLAAALFKPVKPPLTLSFSWIYDFERCPRCFYLRRILRFPEPEAPPQLLGSAAHQALAAFYRRTRAAEADGGGRPTLQDLLSLGRAEFLRLLPVRAEADPEQLCQLESQLRLTHERLISETDDVQEVEHTLRFPYPCAGYDHEFEAKVDRLDRLPSGHRIVDYKTGKPSQRLLQPADDDLQLGIYAMALRHHQNGVASSLNFPAIGSAEYWILSTGQRGSLNLADVRYDKLQSRIDEVITKLLTGPFERGKPGEGCWGLCEAVVGP
jgi:DNA helicase II / ATP-dependent DNA helicase PcrA